MASWKSLYPYIIGWIRIRRKRSRIWNTHAKIPLSCRAEICSQNPPYRSSRPASIWLGTKPFLRYQLTCILEIFSHCLAEDTCRAEDEGIEATITAEDLDISSVQLTGPCGSSCSSAEKPAPKNIFYFYQVPVAPYRVRIQSLVKAFARYRYGMFIDLYHK